MKRRKLWNRITPVFLHFLLLMTAFVFQGAIFPYLKLGGYVPLLLPVAVTGIALYEGRDIGGICGLFGGILCDISFNHPVGVFTVVLTLVGLGVGILSDTVILSGFVSFYLSAAAVLIIVAFVQMTPILALPNNVPIGVIITTATMQTFYALIFALPIWFAVRALGKQSERKL